MPMRVIGYDGAIYRGQLSGKGKKKCYPVITLVLYFGYEKRWKKNIYLHECFDIPKELVPCQKMNHPYETMKLLSLLTKDRRFLQVCKRNEKGGITMCEVLDRVEQRGCKAYQYVRREFS